MTNYDCGRERIVAICGYRIAAIMLPCQGRDTGPTPVTRSILSQGLNGTLSKKMMLQEG